VIQRQDHGRASIDGHRPRFWEHAEYYGETGRLAQALTTAEAHGKAGNAHG
jgi:hypothetical protein